MAVEFLNKNGDEKKRVKESQREIIIIIKAIKKEQTRMRRSYIANSFSQPTICFTSA